MSEQLTFWLKFIFGFIIIIPLGIFVLAFISVKLERFFGTSKGKKYDSTTTGRILMAETNEIYRLKNKLHYDYGLTRVEIDNYLKEQKEKDRVIAVKNRWQWKFNAITTLEKLIEIKESEISSEKGLEDQKEDFKTKIRYEIIFGLINMYNQNEVINFSNRVGLLDIHISEVSEDESYNINSQLKTDLSEIFPNSIAFENDDSWEIITDIPEEYYNTIDFTGEHNYIEFFEKDEYDIALNFIKNLKTMHYEKAIELGILVI